LFSVVVHIEDRLELKALFVGRRLVVQQRVQFGVVLGAVKAMVL